MAKKKFRPAPYVFSGALLKSARKAAGLTQEDLVIALYQNGGTDKILPVTVISAYECGGSPPKSNRLKALARSLQVSTDAFFAPAKRRRRLTWPA